MWCGVVDKALPIYIHSALYTNTTGFLYFYKHICFIYVPQVFLHTGSMGVQPLLRYVYDMHIYIGLKRSSSRHSVLEGSMTILHSL